MVSNKRRNLGAIEILLSAFTTNSLDDYIIKVVTIIPPAYKTIYINCKVVSNVDSRMIKNLVYPINFILRNDTTYTINSIGDSNALVLYRDY